MAWWRGVVVAAWVGALLVGSLASGETKSAVGTQGEYHRVWHVGAFGATVLVVGWGLGRAVKGWQAGMGTFGLGLGCELLQRAIYIPVVEWEDVGDDAVGAAIGWLVLTVWRRWRTGETEAVA